MKVWPRDRRRRRLRTRRSPIVGRRSHAEAIDLLGVRRAPPGRSWSVRRSALLRRTHLAATRPRWRPASVGLGSAPWSSAWCCAPSPAAASQLSFVIVAGIVLAVFLLGWRTVVRLVRRARTRTNTPV